MFIHFITYIYIYTIHYNTRWSFTKTVAFPVRPILGRSLKEVTRREVRHVGLGRWWLCLWLGSILGLPDSCGLRFVEHTQKITKGCVYIYICIYIYVYILYIIILIIFPHYMKVIRIQVDYGFASIFSCLHPKLTFVDLVTHMVLLRPWIQRQKKGKRWTCCSLWYPLAISHSYPISPCFRGKSSN